MYMSRHCVLEGWWGVSGSCELMFSFLNLRSAPQTARGINSPNVANYLKLSAECQKGWEQMAGRCTDKQTHTKQCVQTCCYAYKEPLVI